MSMSLTEGIPFQGRDPLEVMLVLATVPHGHPMARTERDVQPILHLPMRDSEEEHAMGMDFFFGHPLLPFARW